MESKFNMLVELSTDGNKAVEKMKALQAECEMDVACGTREKLVLHNNSLCHGHFGIEDEKFEREVTINGEKVNMVVYTGERFEHTHYHTITPGERKRRARVPKGYKLSSL